MDAFKPCHKVLSWNVHGLNNVAKQEEVRQVINLMQPDLTCLQETKLEVLTPAIIRNTLVVDYEHNFLFQPALGTGGGSSLHQRSQDLIFRLLNVLIMPSLQKSMIVQPMLLGLLLGFMGPKMILRRRCS
jgi:hypothetical protein